MVDLPKNIPEEWLSSMEDRILHRMGNESIFSHLSARAYAIQSYVGLLEAIEQQNPPNDSNDLSDIDSLYGGFDKQLGKLIEAHSINHTMEMETHVLVHHLLETLRVLDTTVRVKGVSDRQVDESLSSC